jgi:hypothetical protein
MLINPLVTTYLNLRHSRGPGGPNSFSTLLISCVKKPFLGRVDRPCRNPLEALRDVTLIRCVKYAKRVLQTQSLGKGKLLQTGHKLSKKSSKIAPLGAPPYPFWRNRTTPRRIFAGVCARAVRCDPISRDLTRSSPSFWEPNLPAAKFRWRVRQGGGLQM